MGWGGSMGARMRKYNTTQPSFKSGSSRSTTDVGKLYRSHMSSDTNVSVFRQTKTKGYGVRVGDENAVDFAGMPGIKRTYSSRQNADKAAKKVAKWRDKRGL